MYMPITSRMSSIVGQIEPKHPELFALEFGKIAEYDFVYTVPSTNINQSAPNLVKMYVIIRSRMSYVDIDQSVANLATMCMPIRSRMSSIMGQIELEHPELFALEFGKITESVFVYTLASTNINQSAPRLVKMYVTIRSRMSSIIDLMGPVLSELFVLEFAKIAESDFVYFLAYTNVDQLVPNMVTIYMIMRFWMSLINGKIRQ